MEQMQKAKVPKHVNQNNVDRIRESLKFLSKQKNFQFVLSWVELLCIAPNFIVGWIQHALSSKFIIITLLSLNISYTKFYLVQRIPNC